MYKYYKCILVFKVYSVLGDRLDCAKLLILYGASVSLSWHVLY